MRKKQAASILTAYASFAACIFITAFPSSASTIAIANASFDTPVLATPGAFSAGIPSWTGGVGVQNISGQNWVVALPAGDQVGVLQYNDSISQTLTNLLEPGYYSLSSYVAGRAGSASPFPFHLQLYAGTTLLSEAVYTAVDGVFKQYSTFYVASTNDANLGQPLKIVFNASVGENYASYNQTLVDGFQLDYLALAAVVQITNINNASFEDPILSPGAYSVTPIPGWTKLYNDSSIVVQNGQGQWGLDIPDGDNVAVMNYYQNLSQSLTNTLQAGTYTFTVSFGTPAWLPSTPAAFDFIAGGTLINETYGLANNGSTWVGSVPQGAFYQYTATYNIAATNLLLGQPLSLKLWSYNSDYGIYNQTMVDNVRLYFVPAAPVAAPTIVSVSQTGSQLIMVWSGGANSSSKLLSATNVAQAKATWTPVATNSVGANGLSTNIITIDPSEAKRFYLLSLP